MSQPTGVPQRRTWWMWLLGLIALVVIVVASVWLIKLGQLGQFTPGARRDDVPAEPASFVQSSNGATRMSLPVDDEGKRERQAILEQLRGQKKINEKMLEELEALKKARAVPRDTRETSKTPPEKPIKVVSVPRTTAVYYRRTESLPDAVDVNLTLVPTTVVSCALRSAFNSDVPGVVAVKIITDVKDSATLRTTLIPQDSNGMLRYGKKKLIYGEEAVELESATLSFPNAKTIEFFDHAAVDQMGRMGWRGRVHHHFWRIFSAVLIRGALRGSAQTIQTGVAGNPLDGVISGVGQGVSQAGQQQTQPYINSSPTIEKDGGERCHILLTEELKLPPYTPEATYAAR